jgi:hypothetical protein
MPKPRGIAGGRARADQGGMGLRGIGYAAHAACLGCVSVPNVVIGHSQCGDRRVRAARLGGNQNLINHFDIVSNTARMPTKGSWKFWVLRRIRWTIIHLMFPKARIFREDFGRTFDLCNARAG